MSNPQLVDIVTVAKALQGLADERRERQMKAMESQQPRHRPEGDREPNPWQENAIRIMEDRSE